MTFLAGQNFKLKSFKAAKGELRVVVGKRRKCYMPSKAPLISELNLACMQKSIVFVIL